MPDQEEVVTQKASQLAYKEKLAVQCRRVLQMPEFMKMLEKGIDDAIRSARGTTGQVSDRHFWASVTIMDMQKQILDASKFKPGEKKQKPPVEQQRRPAYE